MANGNGFWGFLGNVGSGALDLGGAVIDVGWSAGQAVYGAGESVYGFGGDVIEYMGTEDGQALAKLAAQGYGQYASALKQKAAVKATQKFGGQVVVPYPVGAVGAPSPQGGFQTLFDIDTGQPGQPKDGAGIGEKEIKIIAIGVVAFLILRTL